MKKILIVMAVAGIIFSCSAVKVFSRTGNPGSVQFSGPVEKISSEKGQKETEKNEGKQVSLDRLGFKITMPGDTWKAEVRDDDDAPLELSHPGSGLIQLVTFQKTMATIPELTTSLNAVYERKFGIDGAKEYAIKVSKDYKYKSLSGKRLLSTFKKGNDIFVLDQVYLEGTERIFVLVLTIKKAGYDAVKGDFEAMIKSIVFGEGDKQVTPP